MTTLLNLETVQIPEGRQRKLFDQVAICDLAESIARRGLMHPPVVRVTDDGIHLVAGERRLIAIKDLNEFEIPFRCDGEAVPFGMCPVTLLSELSAVALKEAELEENIVRVDLSLQERAAATLELHRLRNSQRTAAGEAPQTVSDTATEIYGYPRVTDTAKLLRVAENAEVPGVAAAKTLSEAYRAIERKVTQDRYKAAAEGGAGKEIPHECFLGDSLELMLNHEKGVFDVIVTDPPYGIAAQSMKTFGTTEHRYDDSEDYWRLLMTEFAKLSLEVCAEQAHAYVFCSILRFPEIATIFRSSGWAVWKFPFIWARGSGLTPAPDYGPMRSYDAILFASKGKKKVLWAGADVLFYSIKKETSFAAEKPVDLYIDLFKRSCGPGARVLDPFAGSGTVFPAAEKLGLIATGIERDPETFKIALGRMNMTTPKEALCSLEA